MLKIAFDFEPVHHIRYLASLSLTFPSYQMPWASTDAPMMMFADAIAIAAVDADAVVVVVGQSMHFVAAVGDAAAV